MYHLGYFFIYEIINNNFIYLYVISKNQTAGGKFLFSVLFKEIVKCQHRDHWFN